MGTMHYFRLNPECYLNLGKQRAVVHNLYTGQVLWCDEKDARTIARCEKNIPFDDCPSLLVELHAKGWGFFAERPTFVDKLRTFNAFREKRLWRETPFAHTAILQVSNTCPGGCEDCLTAFCPLCTILGLDERTRDPLTVPEWLDLIKDLSRFGVRRIFLTGGDPFNLPELPQLAEFALARGVSVNVHTSGKIPVNGKMPAVSLSTMVSSEACARDAARNLAGRDDVTLMCNFVAPEVVKKLVNPKWKTVGVSRAAPRVTPASLKKTALKQFFARKSRDRCLDGKIHVGFDGGVHPCFGHRSDPVADIRRDRLSGAIRKLVDDWWSRPVDTVFPDRKCGGCEFRYCCNACRFVDVKALCGYEPALGIWASGDSQ